MFVTNHGHGPLLCDRQQRACEAALAAAETFRQAALAIGRREYLAARDLACIAMQDAASADALLADLDRQQQQELAALRASLDSHRLAGAAATR